MFQKFKTKYIEISNRIDLFNCNLLIQTAKTVENTESDSD